MRKADSSGGMSLGISRSMVTVVAGSVVGSVAAAAYCEGCGGTIKSLLDCIPNDLDSISLSPLSELEAAATAATVELAASTSLRVGAMVLRRG